MFLGENNERCLGVCQPAQFFPNFFLLKESKLGISITSVVDGLEIAFKEAQVFKRSIIVF